jgi:hypothetical protein
MSVQPIDFDFAYQEVLHIQEEKYVFILLAKKKQLKF